MANGDAAAVELVTATNFARNFPALSSPIVERDHLLDTLAQVPSADTPVMFLEGADGGGATTLLAQFARKYGAQCFALFVKPASRFSYSPDYLRLMLAEQIWFHLHGTRLDQEFVDITQYESLVLQLRKRIRSGAAYILVDGVHQIAKDDPRLAEIFADVLPVGMDGFRFIITGRQDDLARHLKAIKSKPYQLLKFADHESRQLLADLPISPEEREQLLKLCEGNPGRLSSVRRLITSGTPADTILQSEPSRYLEFLGLEFGPIAMLTETQRLLLAVLAFSRHALSMEELIGIVPLAVIDDLNAIKHSCTFVVLDESNRSIEFRSEAHRKLAENSLKAYKQQALGLQVEALIREPDSSAAVRLLPSYYQSLNQQQAIIDLLSKEHYAKLLELTQSISALKARAALGARSALELRQATEVLQFALQRSVFSAVADIEELQSEVSALVALGQSQRALDMAAQGATKEKRLFLLAEYARRTKEQGGVVDGQVVAYIRELAAGLDFHELDEAAIRLSENLLFVDPDLALLIVDNALRSESSAAVKDAAFAHLSITASLHSASDESLEERPRSRIGDERLQGLIASLTSIVADFSFAETTRVAMEMEIGRRIYFLRHLVAANTKRANVLDVVDFALDQLVANTTYTPKARDLADLAIPLATPGHDLGRVKQLVRRLEGQVGLVEKGAPSADLMRLQMSLAHAELAYDVELARSRISEAYYAVAGMDNLEIRLLCLAAMSYALSRMDQNGILEGADGFRAVILDDLKRDVEVLLEATASHYQVAFPILKALSSQDPVGTLSLVQKLNTENRRDRALADIARHLIAEPWSEVNAQQLHASITNIVDPDLQNDCIVGVMRGLSRSKHASEWAHEATRIMRRARKAPPACEVAVHAAVLGAKLQLADIVNDASAHFDATVEAIDSLPYKLDLLFRMSAACASVDVPLAGRYYDAGRVLKDTSSLSSTAATEILHACLLLLIRAFRGLIKADQLPDDYLDRFAGLSEQLPCTVTRAILYNELVCKAWCEGRTELVATIVNRWCRPLLDATHDNALLYAEVIEALFPALYCAHPVSAYALLPSLSVVNRAHALVRVSEMVLRKLSPGEPAEGIEEDRVKVTHEQLIDLIVLMEHAPTDWSFYAILNRTAKAASHRENRTRVSGQQRVDFANRVQQLIVAKLPDLANIRHQGYVVASQARVLSIQVDSKLEEWNALIAQASAISNIADRAYVYLEIVQCMPSKYLAEQRSLAVRAHADVCAIPSVADRYGRLESYIRTVRKIAPAEARAAIKQALLLTFEHNQPQTAAAYRRSLVDLAEAMESDIVDQLAEAIDDDPARADAKSDIKNTVEIVKLRKKLAAANDGKQDEEALTSAHLPGASWRNLSALVAGRLETKAPDRMMKYVNAAGAFSLREAYPVLSWFIENCTRRFTTAQDVGQQILPLSEVLLLSTEIAASVIAQAPSKRTPGLEATSPLDDAFVVKPGERDAALEHVRQWLRFAPNGPITYCDPYFDQSDVELLRIVLAERPESSMRVLTSMKSVAGAGRHFTYESFMQEWSDRVDQDPPETEVLAIVGAGTDEVLVHDRWLIVGERGLRLGTSFKSLGIGKLSEISPVTGDECAAIVRELDHYFSRRRMVNGQRVTYASINL